MYVCVCRAVTDGEVKAAIDAGASSVQEVTEACCAGEDCGACHDMIDELIAERRNLVPLARVASAARRGRAA
ncbi:MAG TPA: (2Fe-2S)-binding protein [Polyangiaceae bacterium]|nr:(2Fe-2S)-binding protein [Polyangiaceae bacterium]